MSVTDRMAGQSGLRATLLPESRRRSTARGVTAFAAAVFLYAGSLLSVALVVDAVARVVLAIANGLVIVVLFVVGHDACHGSLTARSGLNRLLGRLAFLPSYQPYTSWEYTHNALHHGWTNLKGRDPVYCPFSKEEFDSLPRWRRVLERIYRTPLGIGLLYLVEIWWKLEVHPDPALRAAIDRRGTLWLDRALVVAFACLQVVLLLAARRHDVAASPSGAAALVVTGLLVPFLVASWLMGFATFQHHTHPRSKWFSDEREWAFHEAQVEGTVHVVFPRPLDVLLLNIMEHTAHHVDTRVPHYRLIGAQRRLEQALGEAVVRQRFTWRDFRHTLETCQLYDYRSHRWLDFDGRPTT